jgi:signal transduction histidine kinase
MNKPQLAPSELADVLADYLDATSVLAIVHVDRDGMIISTNETLERLAGQSLAGRSVRELVRVEQQPVLARMLESTDHRWHRATLGLIPDRRGIPVDFAVSCRPLGSGQLLIAEPLGATAVDEQVLSLNAELAAAQRRISRQNAELAHHNDALRELDRLKDAVLANVSHDLRTPLTAILGYAELLRRRGGLNDQQAKGVDVIERNARRLLRLVSDLLLLAQVRAGELRLQRQAVDLPHLAADAVESARPLADHAELSVELHAAPHGPVVEADALRLGQLLDNLLANAIKFTPAGGTVTVRVLSGAGTATLEVEDTGPGLPEDERESVFEAFARGTAAEAPGTGLGLTIVRAIAAAHGATIAVHSEPGRGARFTVTFRTERPAPPG